MKEESSTSEKNVLNNKSNSKSDKDSKGENQRPVLMSVTDSEESFEEESSSYDTLLELLQKRKDKLDKQKELNTESTSASVIETEEKYGAEEKADHKEISDKGKEEITAVPSKISESIAEPKLKLSVSNQEYYNRFKELVNECSAEELRTIDADSGKNILHYICELDESVTAKLIDYLLPSSEPSSKKQQDNKTKAGTTSKLAAVSSVEAEVDKLDKSSKLANLEEVTDSGEVKSARLLDINMIWQGDKKGVTAFHMICGMSSTMEVFDLISEHLSAEPEKSIYKKNINLATKDGRTPLYIASESGRLEIVEKLLSQEGVEVNKATEYGWTPLIIAIEYGKLEVIEKLLKQEGVEVNKTSKNGWTLLCIASYYGHKEVVGSY